MDTITPAHLLDAASSSRSDLLLQESLVLLKPLISLLVANGVTQPVLAQALKSAFVEAARHELDQHGKKVTDSALSVLSGVHRKDVRVLNEDQAALIQKKAGSVAAEVYTRWSHDAQFCDAQGKPLALSRSGAHPSFDSLAAAVSRDIHPRTLLEEMLRLAVVTQNGEKIEICANAFVPQADFAEMAYFFSRNLKDHLAAGAANLQANLQSATPPFLEQSVFADELSEDSIRILAGKAHSLWTEAFKVMVSTATQCCESDARVGQQDQRMRFGIYFYNAPMSDDDGFIAALSGDADV